ncbi:hypothetical protein [Aestuariibaculum lutulentum]|uniref:Lipoprotein n=1 Tax=Aestuariibaculum lutulentum TaxID=2920935 RepID=A0ABS9RMF2_9FLAO|nr:hypothetical protein [Aestuariibaculum lutulentum]MCH4554133.1 hypothetical protein [Aestuariibaculum lutulentum]
MKILSQYLLLLFIIISSFQCSTKKESLTPEKIIGQIEPIEGWSESKINRPNFYVYKLMRDSGYASIAISKQKELLFGKYKSSDFQNINELLSNYTDYELKSQFHHWESKDERAIPKLISIRKSSLGEYNSLQLQTEYNMNGKVLSVDYEILLTNKGWISIGCSYAKLEKGLYKNELDSIVRNIGIKI